MSIISEVLGMGADGIGNLLVDAREAITGKKILDPNEQTKLANQLTQLSMGLQMGQLKVDEAEANSTNWFVAGWRPAVGWVCALAFAYSYIVFPFLQFAVYTWADPVTIKQIAALPHLNLGDMMPVLLGMLGLGGMRSYEKSNGTQNTH